MKKVLLITSAFVLALGLCGCEKEEEKPKTPDINSETIAVEMLVYMVEDGKYLRKDIQNGIVYEFVFENNEYKNTKVERTFVSSKKAEEFYNGNEVRPEIKLEGKVVTYVMVEADFKGMKLEEIKKDYYAKPSLNIKKES